MPTRVTSSRSSTTDKLGMFIHWGLYSLTSAEWKGERVPGLGEWVMWHAMIPRAEYAELGKLFNPRKFNAVEWVSMAKNAGHEIHRHYRQTS